MPQAKRRQTSALHRMAGAVILAAGTAALLQAQIPGRNVNMVSGDKWPDGDPYLQRQNEPSLAASTRNPLHLLGGSNDYRTVDIPGLPNGGETGDAWLGLYKSFDGGQRWQSTLLPGYPQDTSAIGRTSPIYGYQAGADPVVRPGTSGLFYFSGIVFDRTANGKSRVFVSRFIDNNNKEAGDPIHYLGTSAVASHTGAGGGFIDKPWIAVDVPRAGARTCSIETPGPRRAPIVQRIPAGNVYLAYTLITHGENTITGTIMFSRSTDCGVTWSDPVAISQPADKVNQGATLAVDPVSGAVYVAWRKFGLGNENDAIVVTRAAAGQKFERPRVLREFAAGRDLGQLLRFMLGSRRGRTPRPSVEPAAPLDPEIAPFDQGTLADRFRTNAYPTMAIDGSGRVYVAWSERGFRTTAPGPSAQQDASIVMSTGSIGDWTAPFAVEMHDNPGHQFMPSLAFAGGKLMLVYYDLREDVSQVFRTFVDEASAKFYANRRHTIDLRATQADPAPVPQFAPSVRVSEYARGSRPGSRVVEQLQYNPPNLPLFQLGQVPFIGDYVDIAPAPMFVQNAAGVWQYNTQPTSAPVFHTAWTDNRDVKPPQDGIWTNYTPPTGAPATSAIDPSQTVPSCIPGRAGMRNQNVYTSRLTAGLLAGSPGNAKPLSPDVPRSFVVFAQNTTYTQKAFRMTIQNQPIGGRASFTQVGSIVAAVDVLVPPRSTVSRTVFATSTDSRAKIEVDVEEIAGVGGAVIAGGLASEVILNPDIANPDIANPDIANPDIANPDIANVVIVNPDIANPDIANPDIANPDIANPDIANPDIANPDIANGALTDVTWTVTNRGNTTASYNIDLLGQVNIPNGIKAQLIIHKQYKTPVSDGCTLKYETHTILVTNIVNPDIANPDIANPDIANPDIANATLWLEPGGTGKITLRVLDPDPRDDVKFDPVVDAPVTPKVTAEAVNTDEIFVPTAEPPAATPPSVTSTAMSVTGEPVNAVVSQPIGNVQVRVQTTKDGATSPAAGVAVAVGILVNPGGGHLAGTTTIQTDANGYATFAGLSIDRPGTGYQLVFTAAGVNAVPAASAFFTITPAVADPDQNVFIVTTTADSGPGSLRQAIMDANATPNGPGGPDLIAFGFRLPGTYTIQLQSTLPAITQPVTIDGTTQNGYAGSPVVQVSGPPNADSIYGFEILAGPTAVRGLSITGFGTPATPNTTAAIRVAANATIQGNWIGVAPDGSAAGNQTGIWVGSGAAAIGGTTAGARNVISAGRVGILLTGGSGSVVRGNFIGTSPDGLSAMGNTGAGIESYSAVENAVIGGPLAIGGYLAPGWPGNVIAANGGGGISLQNAGGFAPTNTQILGNVIGLNAAGADLGNYRFGVRTSNAPLTRIGAPGAGNVIGGNGDIGPNTPSAQQGDGVVVFGVLPAATMPVIQSNYIGLDPSGMQARPNTYGGVILSGRAFVGGTGAGEGNVIAGNGWAPTGAGTGILVTAGAGGSVVQGNVIGLSATGAPLGNGYSGLTVSVTSGGSFAGGGLLIGGSVPGARNVISGNPFAGIAIYPQGSTIVPKEIVIRGNFIGTTAAGAVAGVGNGRHGISVLESTDVTIGGASLAEANVISGNGTVAAGAGVHIDGPTAKRVAVQMNVISGNNGLGINLGAPGVLPNDNGDADAGPNDQQNYPLLDGAVSNGQGKLRIRLNSQPGDYTVRIYNNSVCDPSGHGEGQEPLFDTTVTVGASLLADVIVTTPLLAAGQILTATAADATGNTSEFSACSTVTAASGVYYSDPASGGNGHYYRYVTAPMSWSAAKAAAQTSSYLGFPGHLVTITSAAENELVRNLYLQMGLNDMRAWIGLADPNGEGQWRWVTAEPFGYANWNPGEPNNIGSERAVEFFADGTWNNNVDTFGGIQGYVVEFEPQFQVAAATDATGDAVAYSQTEPSPDLVGTTVLRRDGDIVFQVRYAPGTYNPANTVTHVALDTDENPSTGHGGTTGGCQVDAANLGTDYFAQHRVGFPTNVLQYAGTCNQFTFRGSVSATVVANGVDIAVPLSLISDDGLLRFKVLTFVALAGGTATAILDQMTNVGLPATSTRSGS